MAPAYVEATGQNLRSPTRWIASVRTEKLKYCRGLLDEEMPEELYDLCADPEERENLAPDDPRTGEMRKIFAEMAGDAAREQIDTSLSAEEIATPSEQNRLVSDPYPKQMNAFPNVDQGAAVIVTSLAVARELGIDDGCLFVVTPDVSSLAARLMGRRWWHYRLAHIAYFTPDTLTRLLQRCGFEPVATYRPGWRFSLAYILERLGAYLPGNLKLPVPAWTHRVNIPLNFFDSILVVARRT